MGDLVRIINEQTGVLLKNVEIVFGHIDDSILRTVVTEQPLWKHFYHLLSDKRSCIFRVLSFLYTKSVIFSIPGIDGKEYR